MRIPLEWLREYVELPAELDVDELCEKLVGAGLEVEQVHTHGGPVTGPLVVGEVVSVEELTGFKKPIRFCRVRVGADHGHQDTPGERGIVCGASNFSAGDLVVVALPGAVLPGDFEIASRRTYDHVSDGMICSERELELGLDHSGIIVLPPGTGAPGDEARPVLGLGETVVEVAVTPDIGYCLSLRGVARELATAYGTAFHDPGTQLAPLPAPSGQEPVECRIEDLEACALYTLATIRGFDPSAPTPQWMRRRLGAAGLRSISLAVDVTNYVMLETGQPLHAFDLGKLTGPVTVRRARPGETLETLDHVTRALDPEDLLIADDAGPVGMAGVMGGLNSEIDDATTAIALEAAWFASVSTARAARRHRLSSDASRRYERGVDRVLAPYAGSRAAALLLELGGGSYAGMVAVEAPYDPVHIELATDLPAQVAGIPVDRDTVVARLIDVGAVVERTDRTDVLAVTAPPWRPDLTDPADLVEEVLRLGGYDLIPSVVPRAPGGAGLTADQRARRRVARALAAFGAVEVLSYPFLGQGDLDALALAPDDPRRRLLLLANPLSDEAPGMRTTLLPGVLATLRRNVGRGAADVLLYEIGPAYLRRDGQGERGVLDPPRPGVADRPTREELAGLEALLPSEPLRLALAVTGSRAPSGWWGGAVPSSWADAVEAARVVADALGAPLVVRRGTAPMPWHPGRVAELVVGEQVVGHAGELHPRAATGAEVPARTAVLELDLAPLLAAASIARPGAALSTYPVAKEDVALVVDHDVPAAEVEAALRAGAGELLESVRLFDVYAGEQVGEGKKSLAYALRLRAPDRTLTDDEVAAARTAAIAAAGVAVGARLRT